eukprot:TRINITY_DN6217_c0_g1_i2.p1 TRINITY_DN6217_c0_g1~~TRINITY_DN6217_c0_g1_i2.p1  ORF type:complete len:205 (-),score=38.82 TRINITY_DN6217_c0_g1_i2:1310-1924(-)
MSKEIKLENPETTGTGSIAVIKESENTNEDEDDDPVVAEISVILSKELDSRLSLLQHPLRPPWRLHDSDKLKEIRLKPKGSILEAEYYSNWRDESEEDTYGLKSSSVPLKTNYAIGLFRGDELYLTPLKNVFQMRPSFKYLDESESRKRFITEEDEVVPPPPSTRKFKSITMQPKKKDTKRLQQIKMQSYENLKNGRRRALDVS